MKITCDHPSSIYGLPVILDDNGTVLDHAPGIKALRIRLNLTTQQLATHCGTSRRTVEGWEQGRQPEAAALNVMAGLLQRTKTGSKQKGKG